MAKKGHLEVQRGDHQQTVPDTGLCLKRLGRNLGIFLQDWAPHLPPTAKGAMGVVAWGLSRCLKGPGVVSWFTLGCSNILWPFSRYFLPQLGNRQEQILAFDCLFLQRVSLALPFPDSPTALLCLFLGGCWQHMG